jgi:hypothetical protein
VRGKLGFVWGVSGGQTVHELSAVGFRERDFDKIPQNVLSPFRSSNTRRGVCSLAFKERPKSQ